MFTPTLSPLLAENDSFNLIKILSTLHIIENQTCLIKINDKNDLHVISSAISEFPNVFENIKTIYHFQTDSLLFSFLSKLRLIDFNNSFFTCSQRDGIFQSDRLRQLCRQYNLPRINYMCTSLDSPVSFSKDAHIVFSGYYIDFEDEEYSIFEKRFKKLYLNLRDIPNLLYILSVPCNISIKFDPIKLITGVIESMNSVLSCISKSVPNIYYTFNLPILTNKALLRLLSASLLVGMTDEDTLVIYDEISTVINNNQDKFSHFFTTNIYSLYETLETLCLVESGVDPSSREDILINTKRPVLNISSVISNKSEYLKIKIQENTNYTEDINIPSSKLIKWMRAIEDKYSFHQENHFENTNQNENFDIVEAIDKIILNGNDSYHTPGLYRDLLFVIVKKYAKSGLRLEDIESVL